MDLGIKGHVAVVTGSGRGIGAATARMLAAEGAKVVVWDRDEAPAQAVADEIKKDGGEALPVTGSVSSAGDVETVARKVLERFGSVHILVNNAGFAHIGPVTTTTDAQWSSIVDVHMTGSFNCVRALAPAMMAQRYGRIINISSLSISAPTKWPPMRPRRPASSDSPVRSPSNLAHTPSPQTPSHQVTFARTG